MNKITLNIVVVKSNLNSHTHLSVPAAKNFPFRSKNIGQPSIFFYAIPRKRNQGDGVMMIS